jgi:hypothetical protein
MRIFVELPLDGQRAVTYVPAPLIQSSQHTSAVPASIESLAGSTPEPLVRHALLWSAAALSDINRSHIRGADDALSVAPEPCARAALEAERRSDLADSFCSSTWSTGTLLQAHAAVTAQSRSQLRDRPAWFGGATPEQAVQYAPAPEVLEPLLGDLVEYLNRQDSSPIRQAALVHFQLTMLHPFRDGNGRLARLLAAVVLRRNGQWSEWLSAIFATGRIAPLEYARVMHAAQSRGLEAILAWWEAAAVHTHTAASALRSLVDKVRESLSGRTSPASASRLLRAACTRRSASTDGHSFDQSGALRTPCFRMRSS